MTVSAQERVWLAIREADLPDPTSHPYTVMPMREGPWKPGCSIHVSAPGSEELISKVTDEDTVGELSTRIEVMVRQVLGHS